MATAMVAVAAALAMVTACSAIDVDIEPVQLASIANIEGARDSHYMSSARFGLDGSIEDAHLPCEIGSSGTNPRFAYCPVIGFGHGNRAAVLLDFDFSASMPGDASINAFDLRIREYDGYDYEGAVELVWLSGLTSTDFGSITWSSVAAMGARARVLANVAKDNSVQWDFSNANGAQQLTRFMSTRTGTNSTILLVRPTGTNSQSVDRCSVHFTLSYTSPRTVGHSYTGTDELQAGMIVNDEGSRDGVFLQNGYAGYTCNARMPNSDTAFPCSGDCTGQLCPAIGFGHGNRIGFVLKIPLNGINAGSSIFATTVSFAEGDRGDYNGDVAIFEIQSSTDFDSLTWNVLHTSGALGPRLEVTLKHQDDATYIIQSPGLNAIMERWVNGAPNRGFYIEAIGTRSESWDFLRRLSASYASKASTQPPTLSPSMQPTTVPTSLPTGSPSATPSASPSVLPSAMPTLGPSQTPSTPISDESTTSTRPLYDTDRWGRPIVPTNVYGAPVYATDESGSLILPTDRFGRVVTLLQTSSAAIETSDLTESVTPGRNGLGQSATDEDESTSTTIVAVSAVAVVCIFIAVGVAVLIVKRHKKIDDRVGAFDNPLYDAAANTNTEKDSHVDSFGMSNSGYMDVPAGYMDIAPNDDDGDI